MKIKPEKPKKPKIKKYTPKRYKKKPNDKKATGRPEWVIDLKRVKELAKIQCTDHEIAVCLNISLRAFMDHKAKNPAIEEAIVDGRKNGHASLRSVQFDEAINKRNTSLLKWLGKQYLGQTEKVQLGNDPENPLPPAVQQNIVAPTTAEEGMAMLDQMVKNFKG